MNIEGSHNLRDLGGFRTADGRTVRHGRLYRSGSLERLTPAGIAAFNELGLAMIVDFRSAIEWHDGPTPEAIAKAIPISRLEAQVSSVGDPRPLLKQVLADPANARALVCASCATIPMMQTATYSVLFRHIAENRLPLLFHCTAGKDRTGTAAAFLLDLLGVDRAAILEDYLASNEWLEGMRTIYLGHAMNAAAREAPDAHWFPLIEAHPSYLDAIFAVVDRDFGGTEGYVREALGLDDDAISAIRRNLTE